MIWLAYVPPKIGPKIGLVLRRMTISAVLMTCAIKILEERPVMYAETVMGRSKAVSFWRMVFRKAFTTTTCVRSGH
jgi:hypothetical protein